MNAIAKLPRAQQGQKLTDLFQLRDRAVQELTDRWVTRPWPTQFLIEVSPLVTWLWLGGIIAGIGGLIAIWPGGPRRRRRDSELGSGDGARHALDRGRGTGAAVGAGSRVAERELVTRLSPPDPAA
jgi:hypothetical protein